MHWLDKWERRYGRYAIPDLMNIVVGGQVIAWLVILLFWRDLYFLLPFTRAQLLRGQVWRLVTFVFTPALTVSPLYLVELYFEWWIGTSLARAWGDFRFDFYFLVGMLGAIAGGLLVGAADTGGLFLSLFFAYAWMWPEQRVLLFFFLPVKIKWLGWAAAALWAADFLFGSLSAKASLLFGLAGFLLFFGRELWDWASGAAASYKRRRDWQNRNR